MLPFLNILGRPATTLDHSDAKPYSPLVDVADASMRTQFRESTAGAAVTEWEVGERVEEEVAEQPEAYAEWRKVPKVSAWQESIYFPRNPEDFLKKHTDRAEIRAALADKGVAFDEKIPIPKDGITIPRAIVYQENYRAQKRDQAILENAKPGLSSFAAQLGGGLVGSLADPINYIPFANGLNRARMLVEGASMFSRAGLRTVARSAAIGAGEGMAGAVVADAVAFPLANRWGADLGWEDALADVALSGVLGAGLSTMGTVFGKRKTAGLHQDAMVKAAADDEAGRAVDVGDILEPAVREVEARGILWPEAPPVQSDHPHGWSGPGRGPGMVEVDRPIPGAPAVEGAAPRPVVSRLVYTPDGEVDIAASRREVKRNVTQVLDEMGLPPAGSADKSLGGRKLLPPHEQTQWDNVEIGKHDAGKILGNAKTADELLAVEAIPEIWRTSSYKGTEPGKNPNALAAHRFENRIKIGENTYQVNITLREFKNGRSYYFQYLKKIDPGSHDLVPTSGGGVRSKGLTGSVNNIATSPDDVKGRAMNFERAGSPAGAPAATPQGRTMEAEMLDLETRAAELETNGKVSPETREALAQSARDLEKARQEKAALVEAADCVIKNGI